MLITKQITATNADELIRHLYDTAFPIDEQIPWDDLIQLVSEMPLDFTAFLKAKSLCFTIVFPRESFNWFWYFAVRKELRGKGYGQQILTLLIEKYMGQICVLDMESPKQVCENIVQRQRRHHFYLRNGFRDTTVNRTYNDITMTIMMMGPTRSPCRIGTTSSTNCNRSGGLMTSKKVSNTFLTASCHA